MPLGSHHFLRKPHYYIQLQTVRFYHRLYKCGIRHGNQQIYPPRFSLEFRQTNPSDQTETLITEYPKVGGVGLVAREDFLQSLVQAFAEVDPVR